ncbi:MAG: hypothetical protein ACXWIU_13175 [Limisphaerales bacterium]
MVWLRRSILILTGLVTFIAAFYAIENWRGKRAWDQCKCKYEAQGYVMDWDALIPPPVPDDQNFYKAPNMSEWMAGRNAKFSNLTPWPHPFTNNSLVALIQLVPPGAAHPRAKDTVIRFEDPNAATNAANFLEKTVGPMTLSTRDFTYVTRLPDPSAPPVLFVETESTLDGQAIAGLFGKQAFYGKQPFYSEKGKSGGLIAFRLESSGANSFRLSVNNVVTRDAFLASAADADKYLRYIREALKRPYARLECSYEAPSEITIPNFVTHRTIAQMLADRAKLDLADGNPDDALEQLTFIHKLCEVLEGRPTHKPMTLVAAMINVAIQGLYCDAVAEGLQKHAWRDTHLQELQDQAKEINVLPFVESALEGERISMARTLQSPKSEVANFCSPLSSASGRGPLPTNAWARWKNPLYTSIRLAPRGWFYQNMVSIADTMQPVINVFDIPQDRVSPRQAGVACADLDHRLTHPTPYNYVAVIAIPNFVRAFQVAAKNQSLINLGYIACALERYHLTHNEYPETLDALVPQFADHIPHDIIGGEPLHYHRTSDGQFKLYSIGWNETDDGGVPEHDVNGQHTGDWVWQSPLL